MKKHLLTATAVLLAAALSGCACCGICGGGKKGCCGTCKAPATEKPAQ